VFFSNVKDNNIFPCLHNIRLSYNIYKCFRMHMSTSNSKHGSVILKVKKILAERESTHTNVQSCPFNEKIV